MLRLVTPALGLAALTACTSDPAPELANPAATFCFEQGGSYDIRDEAAGQVGYCTLADGSEVDAWDYYRENAES